MSFTERARASRRGLATSRLRSILLVPCLLTLPALGHAATREVGAGKTYAAPCAAFAAAEDGDTIAIDAGAYPRDMCAIARSGLTIRGVGGRAVIDAEGSGAQGKAIWIVQGNDTVIEQVEFLNAKVPDKNGAGIRQEGKNLTVRDSVFRHNENGILESNVAGSAIVVERCEFDGNGDGEGYAHNLYIGKVARFVMRESWSHGARSGHLVKSRAAENWIEYNRLTGQDGTASYEIDLPNGGRSFVIGNVIEQGPSTQNPALLAYAQEGAAQGIDHRLYVAHNTFVNRRSNGTFVVVGDAFGGEAKLVNNVFSGAGTVTNYAAATNTGSCTEAEFVDAAAYDFHLVPGSACVDTGVEAGSGDGVSLAPTAQYVHPTSSESRTAVGAPDPGAFEVGGGGGPGTGSSSSSSGATDPDGGGGSSGAGSSGASSSGGSPDGDGSGSGDVDGDGDSGGCDTTAGRMGQGGAAAVLGLGLLAVLGRRRTSSAR